MLDSKTSATDLLMQRWRFPSFSVTSVECDSGVSNPTIIPNSVTATFSVRTVPDQTHDLIVASFEVNLLLVFLWFFSERKQPNEQNFVKDRFSALKSSNSLSFKVGKLLLFCFVCLKKKNDARCFVRELGGSPISREIRFMELHQRLWKKCGAKSPCSHEKVAQFQFFLNSSRGSMSRASFYRLVCQRTMRIWPTSESLFRPC